MSYTHLSSNERYVISHLVLYGLSLREIGQRLNRHHTTISRRTYGTFVQRVHNSIPGWGRWLLVNLF